MWRASARASWSPSPDGCSAPSSSTRACARRVFTPSRLRAFLVVTLVAGGVYAILDMALLAFLAVSPSSGATEFLHSLVSPGELAALDDKIWFSVRAVLEGSVGLAMIAAGVLIGLRREWRGLSIAIAALIVDLTVVNLLVFYQDQEKALIGIALEYVVLVAAFSYRRIYLEEEAEEAACADEAADAAVAKALAPGGRGDGHEPSGGIVTVEGLGAAAPAAGAPTAVGPAPLVRPAALYGLVFFAGIGTMATEMCASRLLAPYFGSSTMIWANIIGLILIALSLGYVIGGRLADRWPSARLLGFIVLVRGRPDGHHPVRGPAVSQRDYQWHRLGVYRGGAWVVLRLRDLFVPSVLLLGMVAPFAIRLGIRDMDKAGSTAGRIFALSTAGSLVGTFLPPLVTIPLLGTQRTLIGAAAVIAAAACLLLGWRWLIVPVVLAGLMAVPPGAVKATVGLIYEKESRYQFVQVVEQG